MKKFLFTATTALLLSNLAISQTTTTTIPTPEQDKSKAEFDKKFRFGLRIAPQPAWFSSSDNTNNPPYGAKFGFGFGLNMEFRLSNIVAFQTGIGGDFEGGKLTYRSEPSENYQVAYWLNNANEMIEVKDGTNLSDLNTGSNTSVILKERSIKTTYVSIPAILKLSTSEYSGLKYFGLFGIELGARIKSIAKDTYLTTYKYNSSGVTTSGPGGAGESTNDNINIKNDASLIPIRLGLNVGLGTEYRLGGSTSLFFSVNYFRSFTNLMRSKESKYLIYNIDNSSGSNKFSYVKQNLIQNAVRINIGVMF